MPTPFSFYHHDHRRDPFWTGMISRDPTKPRPEAIVHDTRTVTAEQLVSASTSRLVFACGPWTGFIDRVRRELRDTSWTVARVRGSNFTLEADRPDPVIPGVREHVNVWNAERLFGDMVSGDDCPPLVEVRATFNRIIALLKAHTSDDAGNYILPKATPAMTGLDFVSTFMPRHVQFERLSDEHRGFITARTQQRKDVVRHRGRGKELRYYDYKRFYRSLAAYAKFPIGIFRQQITRDFADDYQASWYLVTARVPDNWRHVGLVFHDGHWPDKPGTSFHGWFAEPEARMIKSYGWLQAVHERLVTDETCQCLLPIVKRLKNMEADCDGNPLMIHYCKQLLHAAIGRLHPSRGYSHEERILRSDFDPDAHEPEDYKWERGKDGKVYAVVTHRETVNENEIVAPQLSAHLYALGRARITQTLLSIPREQIIGAHMDAIYTTADQSFPYFAEHGRDVPFVLKGSLSEGYAFPKDVDGLMNLSALARDRMREASHGT